MTRRNLMFILSWLRIFPLLSERHVAFKGKVMSSDVRDAYDVEEDYTATYYRWCTKSSLSSETASLAKSRICRW